MTTPLKTYKFKVYHGEEQCTAHSYIGRTVIEAQRLLLLDLILGGIAHERIEIATMPAILESRWRLADGALPDTDPVIGYFQPPALAVQFPPKLVAPPVPVAVVPMAPPIPVAKPEPMWSSQGNTDRFFKRQNPDGYANIVRLTEDGTVFRKTAFESDITGHIASDETMTDRTGGSAVELKRSGYTEFFAR